MIQNNLDLDYCANVVVSLRANFEDLVKQVTANCENHYQWQYKCLVQEYAAEFQMLALDVGWHEKSLTDQLKEMIRWNMG